MNLIYKVLDLPIDKLLHSDQYVYVEEGHGGKPVWNWPIYHFFQLYYSGKNEEACKQFENWYLEQYQKYSSVETKKGGMKDGSLDRLYKSFSDSRKRDELLKKAIVKRVQQRFHLLEKTIEKGYIADHRDPIKVYNRNGKYYLFGGHHRVAVLAAIDCKTVPEVYLFRNNFSYRAFKAFRKLKLI